MTEQGGSGRGRFSRLPALGWKIAEKLATVGGVIGLMLLLAGAVAAIWLWLFPQEVSATVSFNTLNGCARGRLAGLQNDLYLPKAVQLRQGAELLTLCDQDPLSARPSRMAAALADRYAGCLNHISHSDRLEMRANPAAVCRHDAGSGLRYFCQGASAAARNRPVASQLVDPTALPACDTAFLRRIGLPPG